MSDQPEQKKEKGPHEQPEFINAANCPRTIEILAQKILELFNQEQNIKGDNENVYVAHAKTS